MEQEAATEATTEAIEATAEEAQEQGLSFEQYLDSQPDDYKELLSKNGVDSFEKQSKWVGGLNSLIGKKGIIPPSEGASEDDIAKFKDEVFKHLGRPEAGEYEFDLPEGIAEEYVSQDFLDELAKKAYDNGISNQGFQDIINHVYGAYKETISSIEAVKAQIKEMQSEGSLDDSASATSGTSRQAVHDKAKTLAVEAKQAFANGDFAKATALDKEAKDLYAKLATLS